MDFGPFWDPVKGNHKSFSNVLVPATSEDVVGYACGPFWDPVKGYPKGYTTTFFVVNFQSRLL